MRTVWIAVAFPRYGQSAEPLIVVSALSKEHAENQLVWALLCRTQNDPDGEEGWTACEAREHEVC